MKAKLPISDDPGYKNVAVYEATTIGDVTYWAIDPDIAKKPWEQVFVVVDGVLIVIAPLQTIQNQASQAEFLGNSEALLEKLRESTRGSSYTHKLSWEALGLPADEWLDKKRRLQEERDSRRAAQEDTREKNRRFEEERQQKILDTAAAKIIKGEGVSGELLMDVAKHLSIKIAPQTAGVLRRVREISSTDAYLPGKTKSQAIFGVYSQVQKALQGM